MSALSDYTENKILDHMLGTTTFTRPSAVYLALFNNVSTLTATNLEANILTDEMTDAGYSRQPITFHSAVGSVARQDGEVVFGPFAGPGEIAVYAAVVDSATIGAGNVLAWHLINTSKIVYADDYYVFPDDTLYLTAQ